MIIIDFIKVILILHYPLFDSATIFTSSDNDEVHNVNKVDDNSRSNKKTILKDNDRLRQRKVNISH